MLTSFSIKNPMKLSPKGQHTLEHMILLILIMAGIIIGGPYAIRSWNAQMKGWEDSVVDSMTDPLMEAPPGAVAVTGCDPAPWIDGGCGVLSSPPDPCRNTITTCSQTQKLFLRSFPSNCQCDVPAFMDPLPVAKCEYDNSCCTDWSPDSDNPDVPAPDPATECGANASPICPDGEARQTRTCGESPPETRCDPDLACVFNCNIGLLPGPLPADRMQTCITSGDIDDETGLTGDKNYDLVSACTGTKCEVACLGDLIPNLGGTQCVCPPGLTELWNAGAGVWECECGAGSALQCTDATPACSVPGRCCQPCTSGPFAGMPGYCQQY